ncbi:MAG: alpha-amylase family glycosyl hydrolase, partial [Bacteroidota bacterium]
TKATLVLEAPGKTFGYLVGDFSNWIAQDEYQLKQTPDGQYFWLELTGLTPGEAYVFQYWIDGEVKIGDPYATQVADPWNDSFIDEATFPNVPAYDIPEYGIATVIQTGEETYEWAPSEDNWERPDVDHLMIYELLVRDFLETHTFADLIDTLDYLQNLGVNAIELMPFSEFEGNESWGYNPNYFFATDKYYGPKEDLKRFIETAHQKGMAVIMDVVLNHAFGTNPMLRLYFDESSNRPAADNPWFNQDYVGQYQWGYDFNHESAATQAFVDRHNAFWVDEFHIDGYRFDFTKGFTNYAPGGSVDGFDQSRIDLLKRMADELWDVDPDAYIILEHWSPAAEEQQLGDYGMKMWANRSYDYVPAVNGANSGSFNGMDRQSHVSFFNSHDERRIAEHALTEGQSNGSYNVKNPLIMFERMKQVAAFAFLFPGPKMMWQFDELGYDIDINFNGRTGNKPLPWGENGLGYYEDQNRRYIYDAYAGIMDVRNTIGPENLATATTNHKYSGSTRRLTYDLPGTDLVVIGNFGLETEDINPEFTQTGSWYNYFSGEEINVSNTTENITLEAGEWHIYTTERLSDGLPGVVQVYDNPVTITPFPFTKGQEITIRFDASKASPGETNGLIGAEKVYIHSGVALDPSSNELSNIVGNWGQDDGLGEMTEVSENIWEITLTPADYYGIDDEQAAFQLGMYFRDATAENEGYGFRNSVVYFDIQSDDPFVTVEPANFTIDDEITVTFNALRGNRELVGANKVYMHSSVDPTNTTTPWNSAWNNVVGNWGQDDGIGEMSPVPGEVDQWQITLTPRDYYGLTDGDIAYWLAAVFRSADGNIKGTGTPGPIENGIIHSNLDFFIQNQIVVNTEETIAPSDFQVYPNPTNGLVALTFGELNGRHTIDIIDPTGRVLQQESIQLQGTPDQLYQLDLSKLPAGLYLIRLAGEKGLISKQVVKW